ncbi:MAG: hypothetical protein K9J42_04350 [Sulfuritalea sp.]|nr:hypothetical protein [Sulfuritalea sp.]
MRRFVFGILFFALLGSALAADSSAAIVPDEKHAALKILPGRQGYAFEQPEIMIRQRLFGLAHGVSLLAAACLDLPEHSGSAQDAYASWHAKQAQAIKTLVTDLARYYFGSRADESRWQDLVRALNLKDSIQASLGQVSLQEACASLPAAIVRPRYQLDKLLALSAAPQPATAPAAEAVSPSPSFSEPGK